MKKRGWGIIALGAEKEGPRELGDQEDAFGGDKLRRKKSKLEKQECLKERAVKETPLGVSHARQKREVGERIFKGRLRKEQNGN